MAIKTAATFQLTLFRMTILRKICKDSVLPRVRGTRNLPTVWTGMETGGCSQGGTDLLAYSGKCPTGCSEGRGWGPGAKQTSISSLRPEWTHLKVSGGSVYVLVATTVSGLAELSSLPWGILGGGDSRYLRVIDSRGHGNRERSRDRNRHKKIRLVAAVSSFKQCRFTQKVVIIPFTKEHPQYPSRTKSES